MHPLAQIVLARFLKATSAGAVRFAMEHATPEALKQYMEEHPNADPKNHHVKERATSDDVAEPEKKKMKTRPASEYDASHGRQKIRLYRASDSDTITDTASFAETRETAELYRDNPGYGGNTLYKSVVSVDPDEVLDLASSDDAMDALKGVLDSEHDYGSIGVDELVPRLSGQLGDKGIRWVRVKESYPSDTVTWIYVGGLSGGDDPEMKEVSD